MKHSRIAVAVIAAVQLGGYGSLASAQPKPQAGANGGSEETWPEADKLFAEGRAALTRPKDLEKACDLLTRSYALRQRGDTLLNLAECHRRQGKTATAWREFDEAIRYAVQVEFPEAIAAAATRRDELASRLTELYVEVDKKSVPPDLEVLLDGKRLPDAQWNERLFVDPGKHEVKATAPGYEPFYEAVEVLPKAGGTALRVVPKKLPAPPPVPPPPPPTPPPKPKTTAPPAETPVWPYVVGGAGLAAMGVAVVFGVDSLGAGGELDDQCGAELRDGCPRGYDFESVRGNELRSFGLFLGLGIAGLAATTVGTLAIVLPRDSRKEGVAMAPWVGPTAAGITVRGSTW